VAPEKEKAERRLRTIVREMTPPNCGQSLTAYMKELSPPRRLWAECADGMALQILRRQKTYGRRTHLWPDRNALAGGPA
jgi:hypothetical protein